MLCYSSVNVGGATLFCIVTYTCFSLMCSQNITLPRIFKIFRGLGLRHLVVVNDRNRVRIQNTTSVNSLHILLDLTAYFKAMYVVQIMYLSLKK